MNIEVKYRDKKISIRDLLNTIEVGYGVKGIPNDYQNTFIQLVRDERDDQKYTYFVNGDGVFYLMYG